VRCIAKVADTSKGGWGSQHRVPFHVLEELVSGPSASATTGMMKIVI
jgi:hypothetical protein